MRVTICYSDGDVPVEVIFFLMGAGMVCEAIEIVEETKPPEPSATVMAFRRIGQSEMNILRRHADLKPFVMSRDLNKRQRVEILQLGVADCLRFPDDLAELAIKLRRQQQTALTEQRFPAMSTYECGDTVFNAASGRITTGNAVVMLTRMEARILSLLAEQANAVVSRQRIDMEIGRAPTRTPSRAIDVMVSSLRLKLADAGARAVIHTVRNQGYSLVGCWRKLEGASAYEVEIEHIPRGGPEPGLGQRT